MGRSNLPGALAIDPGEFADRQSDAVRPRLFPVVDVPAGATLPILIDGSSLCASWLGGPDFGRLDVELAASSAGRVRDRLDVLGVDNSLDRIGAEPAEAR